MLAVSRFSSPGDGGALLPLSTRGEVLFGSTKSVRWGDRDRRMRFWCCSLLPLLLVPTCKRCSATDEHNIAVMPTKNLQYELHSIVMLTVFSLPCSIGYAWFCVDWLYAWFCRLTWYECPVRLRKIRNVPGCAYGQRDSELRR